MISMRLFESPQIQLYGFVHKVFYLPTLQRENPMLNNPSSY